MNVLNKMCRKNPSLFCYTAQRAFDWCKYMSCPYPTTKTRDNNIRWGYNSDKSAGASQAAGRLTHLREEMLLEGPAGDALCQLLCSVGAAWDGLRLCGCCRQGLNLARQP